MTDLTWPRGDRHFGRIMWLGLGAFIMAVTLQIGCEAERDLRLEEQRAIVDAAKRNGQTIVYEGDNAIGRVVKP